MLHHLEDALGHRLAVGQQLAGCVVLALGKVGASQSEVGPHDAAVADVDAVPVLIFPAYAGLAGHIRCRLIVIDRTSYHYFELTVLFVEELYAWHFFGGTDDAGAQPAVVHGLGAEGGHEPVALLGLAKPDGFQVYAFG